MESHLYRVRPSNRAKRLALRLDPVERVFELVIPPRCALHKAYEFADQHEQWMQEKLSDLPLQVKFEKDAIIPLNGEDVTIQISLDKNRRNTSISLRNNVLEVLTNKSDAGVRIKRWLKAYAQDILKQKSQEKALSISKKIEKVTVRDAKTRWGSCSSENTLSYSWRLIFAPPEALDYVVAHEVAHLVHLNHSKAFWNLCRDLSDDFVSGQYWMRNYGHELMKYG